MKNVFMAIAAGAFVFSVSSCQKCATCTVKDEAGATIYEYPETCGKKDEIEDYKKNCEEKYAIPFDYNCDCKE